MAKLRALKPALLVCTCLIVISGLAMPLAAESTDDERETELKNDPETETNQPDKTNDSEELRERIKGKLDEIRKRVCEKRVSTIERIMNKASAQGQKHLEVFNKISERVQEFYAKKGLSVANYDALLAQVSAKKAAAESAINAVKADVDFDCNGDSPVGKVDAFNGKVKTMHQALKDYRTAIKDLIVAVKSAAEAEGDQ